MAKTSTGKVQIVRVPSFSPAARAKVGAIARRGAGIAAQLARDESHTAAALGAAAVLGYVESRAVMVPHVALLGISGTYGALAWVAGRTMKNKTLQHIATGLLACSVRDMVAASAPLPGAPGAPAAVTGDTGGELG